MCNRLNLLLVDGDRWDAVLPAVTDAARPRSASPPSLPPHDHPLGLRVGAGQRARGDRHVAPADGPWPGGHASPTPRPPAWPRASSPRTRRGGPEFLDAYTGTGAFWNATTRLLDGFKLLAVPETGINIDQVPGPRGPVTFRDLYLRQFVIVPQE